MIFKVYKVYKEIKSEKKKRIVFTTGKAKNNMLVNKSWLNNDWANTRTCQREAQRRELLTAAPGHAVGRDSQ